MENLNIILISIVSVLCFIVAICTAYFCIKKKQDKDSYKTYSKIPPYKFSVDSDSEDFTEDSPMNFNSYQSELKGTKVP